MRLIVAADKNFGIGIKGQLLARLPKDLEFFKQMTLGKTIILGRKTLESFKNGQPLPKRHHIVLSKTKTYDHERITTVSSIEALLEVIKDKKQEDIMVIGGGMIYKALLPYCDKAYITRLEGDYEVDVKMPNLEELDAWECVFEEPTLEEHGIKYKHTIWNRIK